MPQSYSSCIKVSDTQICPYCYSSKIIKNGHTKAEKLYELTYTLYDQKARPIRTHHRNHLGGYTQTDTKLDFVGTPQYTRTTHKRTNSDTELTVREEFEYTPEGRLLEHRHKVNTFTIETLSYNDYDELGQLKTKNVGSSASTPLQTVDYKYNIRVEKTVKLTTTFQSKLTIDFGAN